MCEHGAVARFRVPVSVGGMPQQPQLEARVGNDCVNGSGRPTFPQNLVKLVMLIDIDDEYRPIEVSPLLGLLVLLEYSRWLATNGFDRKGRVART